MYCEVNEAEIRDETAEYTEIPNNLVRRLVSPIQIYCTILAQLLSFGKSVMLICPRATNFICETKKSSCVTARGVGAASPNGGTPLSCLRGTH